MLKSSTIVRQCHGGLRNGSGFTLVEILVAVAIFSLIAAISFATLDGYLKARDKVAAKYDSLQQLQRLFTLLERDFRFAVDRQVRDENGELEPVLGGAESAEGELVRITIVIPDPQHPGSSSLQRVSWRLQEGELYRLTWQVLDRVQDSEPTELLVGDRIESVELAYFDWDDGKGLRQVAEWGKEDRLPYGIELTIAMDDEKSYRRLFDLTNGT